MSDGSVEAHGVVLGEKGVTRIGLVALLLLLVVQL